ncbi:MAG: EAL domain-containing protein [Frankiales bacterium]|nr:EAL domain-containing protein [Frankiales bacterium]
MRRTDAIDGAVVVAAADERRPRWRRPAFLPEGRRLSDEVWQQRHRWLTCLLWLHVPGLLLFGLARGLNPTWVFAQVGLLVPAGLVAMCPRFGRNVRSASTSVGLVIAASVLVHLSGGTIEAHFQFFVILAFLTLYQAWLPFLLALAYIVGEHGIVGALDPRAVYNSPSQIAHPWRWAAIHGVFVLAASTANVWSWRLTEQEALHDGLTGLPNRVFLLDALEKLLRGSGRTTTAVLFVDLDNFKDANDAFGHRVGDDLLIALSHRLQRLLRGGDILARLGGDEFAVVLSNVPDLDAAHAAGARLLTVFEEPVRIGDVTLAAGASVGVAIGDADTSAADLLRNADLAMYEAKRDGGGRIADYRSVLHVAAVRRAELEAELRVALAEEQFVLHYQPIVDLKTKSVVGTEALVRWQHPTRGLVGPADFITAAEQSGLIIPLGVWVIRQACIQTAKWQQENPDASPLTVSVNLSPRQLLDRTLVGSVACALHESGLDPASLCLEITEGSVIKDFDATMPTLNALRTLGVSLALDDFGTGYSSLSYLQRLPVTTVKIDRSFIGDLDTDNPNGQIVLAIIELAHALGMSVTAEGAETLEQLEVLRAMRSDQAQGYVLGRPMPPNSLPPVVSASTESPAVPGQRAGEADVPSLESAD